MVDILAEEIPTEADVTYMISPAPATTATSCLGDENSMVVFCIDVSGSMGGHVSCFLSSFLVFSAKKCKPLEARCNTKLKNVLILLTVGGKMFVMRISTYFSFAMYHILFVSLFSHI